MKNPPTPDSSESPIVEELDTSDPSVLLEKMVELDKMEARGLPSYKSKEVFEASQKNPKKPLEVVDVKTADMAIMKPQPSGWVNKGWHAVTNWFSSLLWNFVSGDVYQAQMREKQRAEKTRLRRERLEKTTQDLLPKDDSHSSGSSLNR